MEKKFTYDEGEEQRSGADHSKGPNLRRNGEPRGKELLFDVPSDGKQESQRKNEQNRLGKGERKRERGKGRNKLGKNNHNDSIYREIRFQCQYRWRWEEERRGDDFRSIQNQSTQKQRHE